MPESFLSVVIPVFNEKETILKVINKVLNLDFVKEVIVIEDGSTDGTRELLKEIKSDERVKIIFHDKNLGKGASLKDGFKEAKGRIIATQDADLEYDPDELKELTIPILEGLAEVVYGSRFLRRKPFKGYLLHRLANKFLTFITNLLYHSNLTDMETGYKVFKRNVIKEISIRSKDFSVEPELTAKILKRSFKIYEVPISYYGRIYAEGKKIKWIHGFSAIWTLLKYKFMD